MVAIEEGVVIRTIGNRAWIKTRRSAACEHCHSKDSCKTLGGSNDMQVEAVNPVGAKEGDQVVLSFSTASLLKGTFLIYMVPVLCLLIGAGIGVKLSQIYGYDRSAASALVGFGALFASFFFIRAKGNRLADTEAYQPRIIRIKRPLPPDEADRETTGGL